MTEEQNRRDFEEAERQLSRFLFGVPREEQPTEQIQSETDEDKNRNKELERDSGKERNKDRDKKIVNNFLNDLDQLIESATKLKQMLESKKRRKKRD